MKMTRNNVRLMALALTMLGSVALLPLLSAPVQAQEMGALSQVDITEGLAERSAQHVANSGVVPQQLSLQGFASQTGSGMQQQNYSQSPQGYGCGAHNIPLNGSATTAINQQNLSCDSSQNLSNNACQGAENYGNNQSGQNFNNSQNQSFNNCQNNLQQNGNSYNGFANTNNGTGAGSRLGINRQMVGVLGAALLVNYAVNGGMTNLAGEMRARGYNNRFRRF